MLQYIKDHWLDQFSRFLEHAHCLANDSFLIWGLTLSNIITFLEYLVFSIIFYLVGRWGVKRGHWQGLCRATSLMFLFCGINYVMYSVVIWQPVYYLQLLLTTVGVVISFHALYHAVKISKSLRILWDSLRETVKRIGV